MEDRNMRLNLTALFAAVGELFGFAVVVVLLVAGGVGLAYGSVLLFGEKGLLYLGGAVVAILAVISKVSSRRHDEIATQGTESMEQSPSR